MEDLCFDGMYVYKLLTVGLGINNSSWSNIDFTRQVSYLYYFFSFSIYQQGNHIKMIDNIEIALC